MKPYIGVDADIGLVNIVLGDCGERQRCDPGHALLHGKEEVIFADAGYQSAVKREEATGVQWQVIMLPDKRRVLDTSNPIYSFSEKLKASVHTKVEHPFRVMKRQFFVTVRYRGLAKNTARIKTLFALSNLWMARWRILQGLQTLMPLQYVKGPK